MIHHPHTWAFWAAAASGTALYLASLVRAVDVLLYWSPEDNSRGQLRRERRAEAMNLLASGALGCLVCTAVAGLIGIAWIWPKTVSGAMCGTGVIQAMGADGRRALLFWGVSLAILYVWRVQHRLNRSHPREPAIQENARLIVAAAPLLSMSLLFSWQAVMHMDAVPTVSCCAAVYDRVLGDTLGTADPWIGRHLWASLSCQAILLFLSIAAIWKAQRWWVSLAAPLAIVWAVTSTAAVKQVWSAYVYQVLSHPCPWCLFLPDHHGVGFLVFGCMAAIVLESVAMAAAHRSRARIPRLIRSATVRIRQAAIRVVVCIIGFILLTIGPAIAWRLRAGAWLDGSF